MPLRFKMCANQLKSLQVITEVNVEVTFCVRCNVRQPCLTTALRVYAQHHFLRSIALISTFNFNKWLAKCIIHTTPLEKFVSCASLSSLTWRIKSVVDFSLQNKQRLDNVILLTP